MNKYEALYIVNATLEEEPRAALIQRFNTLITDNGGTVDSVDEWGKRRLAYPILDMNEGYYVLVRFSAEPTLPMELERNYRITEDIIRYLVTRIEE